MGLRDVLLFVIYIFSSVLINGELYAQNIEDREYIKSKSNIEALKSFSEEQKNLFTSKLGKTSDAQVVIINDVTYYLSGFDITGKTVYDNDDNLDAAISARTDKVWSGGSNEFGLDGSGIEIGHWEAGGLPRKTHREFGSRVSFGDDESISSHATHTACTIIGEGKYSIARGMAKGATLLSFKSNSDESEIAEFAADGGILSNHSYSTGNPHGEVSEYGVYTANSKEWDEILYNGPYLTLCKSAGNNRDDDVNTDDLGYDIIFTVAGSKNLITVGSIVGTRAYISPKYIKNSKFSNWGPTDDWRIKPDISTDGVDIYSADKKSDKSYESKNGTSMSTAVVTGSAALMQQYYKQKNKKYMRASTVKALIVNTADELGENDGPDFQNGWGLLNTLQAVTLIKNAGSSSIIEEVELVNNDVFSRKIEVKATGDIAITIAWTDPSGFPVSGEDNISPMLVNDLDVRLIKGDKTYYPWSFTPNGSRDNFTDAAKKEDNFRDNVEKIDVKDLAPGNYIIEVKHKGTLVDNLQNFSLVVNGASRALANEYFDISNKIKVYPVPSSNDILHIEFSDELLDGNKKIKVLNSSGIQVISSGTHMSTLDVDVSKLSNGLYFLIIENGSKKYRTKFLVE